MQNTSPSEVNEAIRNIAHGIKSEPSPSIKKMIETKLDLHGTKIIQVLSSQDEFMIYEIDRPNIGERIRIIIDGLTDAREAEIISRLEKVQQGYTKAKGMLYTSSNKGMMMSRVAHALSSSLSNRDPEFDGNKLFESLCKEISNEQKRIITNRIVYTLPVIIPIAIMIGICFFIKGQRIESTPLWQISSSFLAALLGIAVSIYTGSQKLDFEEFKYTRFYAYFGMERVIFGSIFGAIAFMAIKSGLISTNLMQEGYWANLIIITTAGFSEHFTPSIIRKNEQP